MADLDDAERCLPSILLPELGLDLQLKEKPPASGEPIPKLPPPPLLHYRLPFPSKNLPLPPPPRPYMLPLQNPRAPMLMPPAAALPLPPFTPGWRSGAPPLRGYPPPMAGQSHGVRPFMVPPLQPQVSRHHVQMVVQPHHLRLLQPSVARRESSGTGFFLPRTANKDLTKNKTAGSKTRNNG